MDSFYTQPIPISVPVSHFWVTSKTECHYVPAVGMVTLGNHSEKKTSVCSVQVYFQSVCARLNR